MSQFIWENSHSVIFNSLRPHGLNSPWNSRQNTGVGSLSLLQAIFPTQGWNLGLPHCRWILYQLSHKGSPRILEWVAYPFSSGSCWPRNWTRVFCIAGGFFTNGAIREALRTQGYISWGIEKRDFCTGAFWFCPGQNSILTYMQSILLSILGNLGYLRYFS